jgi:hypothetical protein
MRMDRRETGEVRNLSKVWSARSSGITTGPMDEEAKKSVCEIRIGICSANGKFLPIVNARKRVKGNRIPNIIDGGCV